MEFEITIFPTKIEQNEIIVFVQIGKDNEQETVPLRIPIAEEVLTSQMKEPQSVPDFVDWWIYRNNVVLVRDFKAIPADFYPEMILQIKYTVLQKEKELIKIKKQVEAFENFEKQSEEKRREPISESVRLFVWQRDEGKCVKCGSKEKIEFDHIIPFADGGSNTERNIQLLCETCNREKGRSLR